MTIEELRDYVDEQRELDNIPYHVYSTLIDGIDTLEQEPCRDMEEIAEVMKSNADAETKCKMVSNILTAKPHYFEKQEPLDKTQMIDKSNFSQEQYRADLECAFDCGRASVEPCSDVVSRQAVKAYKYNRTMYPNFEDYVDMLPPVNPQPKIGHWRKTPKAVMGEGYMWYCDKCEHQVYQDSSRNYPSENYCPNCGVKMESEDWVNLADDLIPIMNEIESEE